MYKSQFHVNALTVLLLTLLTKYFRFDGSFRLSPLHAEIIPSPYCAVVVA